MTWGIQDMPSEDWLMNKHGYLTFDTEGEAQAYLDSFPKLARPSRFAPVDTMTFYPSGRPGTAYAERMETELQDSLERGLEQSARGEVVDLGDFTQYVEEAE